mmetsp:Transcript_15881/g.22623  ORF Transcript_15881/g.22623 Transcript_15881/m.22623 type:complete len:240 (-) Transcript_15881:33-752(-)
MEGEQFQYRSNCGELEVEAIKMRKEIEIMVGTCSELEKAATNSLRIKSELELEEQKLEEQYQSRKLEVSYLHAEKQSLETQVEQMESEKDKASIELNSMKQKNVTTESNQIAIKAEIDQIGWFQGETSHMVQQLLMHEKTLEQECDQDKIDHRLLEQEREEVQSQLLHLEEEKEELKLALEEAEKQRDNERKRAKSISMENHNLHVTISELEDERAKKKPLGLSLKNFSCPRPSLRSMK